MSWGRYLHVLSAGPMIVVRLPVPEPRWRDILKACTGMMQGHGLRQKDVVAIESVELGTVAEIAAFRQKLESAFAGGPEVGHFWLYEYRDSSFVLVRKALS